MGFILDLINWFTNNAADIGAAVIAVHFAAKSIAILTPTPADDEFIGKVYKYLVDIPALNIGKTKDKG